MKPAITTARDESKVHTIIETAAALKISERTVRDLIEAGEIKALRLGNRIIRVPKTEIERLVGSAK